MNRSGGFGALLGAAMLMMLVADASPARAEPPPACSSDTLAAVYQQGLQNGSSLLQRAWTSYGCGRIRDFRMLAVRTFSEARSEPTSPMVACRLSGMYDGFFQELSSIDVSCDTCSLRQGWYAGEMAAHVYCSLGGMETPVEQYTAGPVSICGWYATRDCRNRFNAVVSANCPELVSSNPPARFRSAACTNE